MKLEQIRHVVEVAKAKSISKAAENIFISQPQLSLSLKNLESEIGRQLFKRSNRGVEATPFGQEYARFAETVLLELEQLKRMSEQRRDSCEQCLSIFNEGYRYVNHAAAKLYERHKNERLFIDIQEGAWSDAAARVEDGSSMIGLVALFSHYKKTLLRQYETRGLQYFRFCHNPVTIILGRNNPLFCKKDHSVSSSELSGYPLVIYRHFYMGPYSTVPDILKLGQDRNRIIVSGRGALYDMLEKTDGFSITSTNQIAYKNTDYYPNIRSFVLANSKISAEIGWIKKKSYNPSPLVLEFLQILSSYYTES